MPDGKPLTNVKFAAAMKGLNKRLSGIETRLGNVETKVGDLDTKVGEIDTRVRSMDTKLTNVEQNMVTKTEIRRVETKMGKMERSLKLRMGKQKSDILGAISGLEKTTPTRKEFTKLKDRVDRYHSTAD